MTTGVINYWEGSQFGAFGMGTSVCLGYSKAYTYLVQCLDKDIYLKDTNAGYDSSNWKTAKELYYTDGKLDTSKNYTVDLVRISFQSDVTMYDIEFMDRKPNFWALIPLYCEMLMSSERIPEDYDMSHLRTIGAGAEAMNDRKYAEVEEFFHKHNVQAKLSAGYGQSEGCSNLTLPNPMFPLEDGCVGMPMTATVLGVFDKDLNELNYGESGELCMTGPSMMLHYSGWRGEELTEQTLVEHPDGNTWLHTGDEAYITEQGIVHILGRGEIKAYGDKPLHVMRMETKTVRTPGVKDGFFCLVPDQEHEGYYRPYLFVILDGTKTLEEVAELLKDTLEEHEYPVEIREITERPYFHFKTDRKGLTAQILKELEQAKEEK